MDSTVVVALIGTASTVAVAALGYVFKDRSDKRVDEANRRLAEESHRHERELAENAQAHERQLRQSERAYDDRKATYRRVAAWALVTAQQVQLSEPMLKTNQMPEPPPGLSDEEWSNMLVEVGLFGSPAVSKAMEEFRDKVHSFNGHLFVYRSLREQNAPHMGDSAMNMHNARGEVTAAYDRLTGAMRDELASL